MMHIVLHEPEIPSNTGNIARTCACTGADLHLIRPLGFELDEKKLRRAGLDYWDKLQVYVYDSFEDFLAKHPGAHVFMATTKGPQTYADVQYGPDDYIMFGKETAGIPEEILKDHREQCIRIPMTYHLRSLNLSNAVAVVLYEALRQQGFPGLQETGRLRNYDWET
ncbi:MAG: tRNA (uridine(34)/cytosine(34)/5-carboxymethylaminomethyluridine(34)-2'-O)-methyltransferase TrmL [Firmicutes bacterium]|nr:tRNA (uridine(34)/cytosine(34)/5-carboxymethylaminomethyluridine(34)-2'-O)-methyltransferase TrmL [Bacillota bacterium]